jgi:hypothetical protein
MDREFTLAVKSAILLPSIAKNSWERLIEEIGFENLNNSTQRVLPKIFKNLESETDVSAYEKLKGDTSEYPKPFKLHTEGLSSYDNSDGIVLGSDKHEYLIWNYGSHACNVEHYIDCKLCKERLVPEHKQ